ncbi:hypothetical protein [Photobacterium leiognathi]|nr:hypothetical protein [Photobacterium leiognathi]
MLCSRHISKVAGQTQAVNIPNIMGSADYMAKLYFSTYPLLGNGNIA